MVHLKRQQSSIRRHTRTARCESLTHARAWKRPLAPRRASSGNTAPLWHITANRTDQRLIAVTEHTTNPTWQNMRVMRRENRQFASSATRRRVASIAFTAWDGRCKRARCLRRSLIIESAPEQWHTFISICKTMFWAAKSALNGFVCLPNCTVLVSQLEQFCQSLLIHGLL